MCLNILSYIDIWTAIIAIGTISIAGAMFRQLYLMRLSRFAQTYCEIIRILQDDETMKARKKLITTNYEVKMGNPYIEKEAEDVCRSFDVVSVIALQNYFPKKIIIRKWGSSIIKCWRKSVHLIEERRKNDNNPTLWKDFETLAKLSSKRAHKLGFKP